MANFKDSTFKIALLAIQNTRDKLDNLVSYELAKEIDKKIQKIFSESIQSAEPHDYGACIQKISEIFNSQEELQNEFSRIQAKYLNLYSYRNTINFSYEPTKGDPTSSPQAGDMVKCVDFKDDGHHYKGLLLFKGMKCFCGKELKSIMEK